MFNKVIFVGNLTKDPELRYSPQGTAVCSFRIAVNSRIKQGEEWKEETLFIDIVVFGKQGESCGKYLAKGKQALIEGRLQERSWESEGQKRSKMEVVAQNVRFLSKRDGGQDTGGAGDAGGAGGAGGGSYKGSGGGGSPPDEVTDLEPF